MLYDYKSKDAVQDVILECLCHLVSDIVDEYENLRRNNSISIVAPSYIGKELISMLLNEDEGLYVHEQAEMSLLEDDVVVLISIFDDGMVFVEDARGLNGELKYSDECVLSYVYDELSEKDVRKLSEKTDSILVFGFEDEFYDESEDNLHVDLITDENDNLVGFKAHMENELGCFEYEYCNYRDEFDEEDICKVLKSVGMI